MNSLFQGRSTAIVRFATAIVFASASGCATVSSGVTTMPSDRPSPDPRVGLRAGLMDAAEAAWNLRVLAKVPPSEKFVGSTNSDLAFIGHYAIQGSYNGYQIWDIADPSRPTLKTAYFCPASQSDVSVYKNLLFVSGEGLSGRLDCGAQGVKDTVSTERLRGLRIFDITDIGNPKNVGNVQTCRGSHTHTVLVDPKDTENVYVYISGSSGVRSPTELPGCIKDTPDINPNSALFRIEVIKVPVAHPEQAKIVSSPRIFNDLNATLRHEEPGQSSSRHDGPTQCHDITVYPGIGYAGGACEGYGFLLDIRDPANPKRVGAVADSNFSYWHSATFNNDGTKILFSDEWGGGGQPKCRVTDKREWGADAIFTLVNGQMTFQSYYKLPAPQTAQENCVAHNGSLIPIPGRDVMVQAWYQGGISVFDWTDAARPKEIAYFDRGPVDSTRMTLGGSWSVYWYNGVIVSSEIARGLDVFELTPSAFISQNEIDAAKTVHYDYLNTQGQPKMVWPASFALARAYLDQLERTNGLSSSRLASVRRDLSGAESASDRASRLSALAGQLDSDAGGAGNARTVRMLAEAVRNLAR